MYREETIGMMHIYSAWLIWDLSIFTKFMLIQPRTNWNTFVASWGDIYHSKHKSWINFSHKCKKLVLEHKIAVLFWNGV